MVPETGEKDFMQNRIAKIEGSQIQKQASCSLQTRCSCDEVKGNPTLQQDTTNEKQTNNSLRRAALPHCQTLGVRMGRMRNRSGG
jgi:hypothetical protein